MKRDGRQSIAEAEVERTFRALPPDLKRFAEQVAVAYENTVGRNWTEDGVAPDSLGLFSGPSFADEDYGMDLEPPLITLFLANLWDYADGDVSAFRREVRTTYLHEFGHFLGLDEAGLKARGLE